MKFNYGYEKKQFEMRWEKLRSTYKEAGMDSESIEMMYQYDLEEFRRYRSFCKYNQVLPDSCIGGDEVAEDKSPLLNRYTDSFSIGMPVGGDSRFSWIDELDNFELAGYLKKMPTERKELITLYVIDGMTQQEIAEILGITRSSVADRIMRIKNNLKKFI